MIHPIENRVQPQRSFVPKSKAGPENTFSIRPSEDSVELAQRDWTMEIEKLLESLGKNYPSVKVITGSFDRRQLLSLIENTGRGDYIYIDQSFLDAMGKSAQAFYEGKALLEQYVKGWAATPRGKGIYSRGVLLTGDSAAQWSLKEAKPLEDLLKPQDQGDTLWDAMRKAKEQAEKNRIKTPKKRSITLQSASKVYARLARASAQTQVRSVMSSAGQSLYRAKMEMLNCEKEDRDDYRAVVSQLQTAISRGRLKIRQLDQEQAMRRRQQRAERQNQLKQARETQQALRKRKSARKAKEYAYMNQSALDSYLRGERARQAQIAQYRAERLNAVANPVDVTSPSGAAPAAPPAWGSALTPSTGSFTLSSGAVASVNVSSVSLSAPAV